MLAISLMIASICDTGDIHAIPCAASFVTVGTMNPVTRPVRRAWSVARHISPAIAGHGSVSLSRARLGDAWLFTEEERDGQGAR
jgi:hypothetical protein